ncbi:MAG: thermonuclease family protein [Planctomycetes bacterium]|nr:thermonuclease family protein [Planctomycetota bacterium]
MNPRIGWKSRHNLWVLIIIVLAVFVYIKHNKRENAPIKDLTQKENETEQFGKSYYDSKIEQITEGPYPFTGIEAVKEGGKIFVQYSVGDNKVKILLAGVKLPSKTEQFNKATQYLQNFLTEQVLRVEIEGKSDEYTIGYVYAYNKWVESSEKSMVNIALNLLSQGLVEVTDDEELEKCRYKDFLLGENDAAKFKKVGIYMVDNKSENEGTEK